MSSWGIFLILILLLLGIAVAMIVGIYNRFVTLKNRLQNSFSQIEVQLKRRHDLIPNLVEIAKGYLQHEKSTLEEVTQARNLAASSLKQAATHFGNERAMEQLAKSEGMLTSALGRLFAVAESYPDLKASENMMQLTEEVTSTENRISFARQAYNDSVMNFNSYKQSFPPVLLADLFGYDEDAAFLEFELGETKTAPKIEF